MNAPRLSTILVGLSLVLSSAAFAADSDAPPQPPPQAQEALYNKIFLITPAGIENLKAVKGIDHTKPVEDQVLAFFKQADFDFKAPSSARYESKQRTLEVTATLRQHVQLERALWNLNKTK